ncbi:MAG: PAS domain S-box protein [Lacunisphaera sp.]
MPKSLKVLIVEDSSTEAELLVQELRNAGFEPEWHRVDTEAEYVDRLQQGINLILSDYELPQLSGLRALELLKQGGLDVPFILVSSTAGEEPAVNSMKLGASDYLFRNRLANLGQSVSQALEAARARAERRRFEQRLLLQGTALDTTANAVVITDAAGLVVWANPAFTTQSGYTTAEVVGQDLRLLKSGRHEPEFYQQLWATVLAGETWRGDVTNRRKDGTLYVDEHTITPVRSKEGAITHFVTIMNDVTKRRLAEDALTAAHIQLRSLLDHSPAVLFALKVEGARVTPLFSSESITRLLGFKVAETLNTDWWLEVLHPDDRDCAIASMARALNEGVSRTEYRVLHKDGSYHWVEENLRLIRNGTNVPVEFAGVWTDITERKHAEEAFAESERRLRETLENINLVAVTLDRNGRVTFCNNHLLQITGWRREEVLGADWFGKFLPESDTVTQALYFKTVEAGEFPAHHDNAIKTKTGEIREIAWNNTMLRDTAGNIMGTASIGDDATDRRRAVDALSASEERFRQVVENIHEVFWMTDVKNNVVLYVSPGYEAIWGRTCESLYASRNIWFDTIHELDRARVEQAVSKRILEKYDETYRIIHADGTVRWIHDRAFPVRNANGVTSRMVGVAEDVTERKKMEEQSLRGQRLECIGMLAAGIAHDLNNVLAPISMAVPMLRVNAAESGDLRMLDILEQCAVRGAGLVRQILGFVHGIGGEPRIVQLKHLLDDIIGVIRETFPKHVVFKSEIPNALWPILANPTQIHQVLLNLCVNARDAMPQGGTLSLRAKNLKLDEGAALAMPGTIPGPWIVLEVEDTGTGIPPEVLLHIWEPFFTTKPLGEGTGLGLSTVRGIVEAHRGFIRVTTKEGHGTLFQIYLPAEEATVSTEIPFDSSSGGRGHGETILFVDDEVHIRHSACSILTQAGYRMLAAADGVEAIKLVQTRGSEIALIITDRDMPLGGGVALAKAVRRQGWKMKILLISGLSDSREKEETSGELADAFIAKPFTAPALLKKVEHLLKDGIVAI